MNEDARASERLLKQVDERLGQGKSSDHGIVNLLADTLPEADSAFQDDLENQLVAQLQSKVNHREEPYMHTMTAAVPVRKPSFSFVTWVAAVIAVVVLGGYALALYTNPQPQSPFAVQLPSEEASHTIVIATQNIRPGTTITEGMVALITLSEADFAELQADEPQGGFFTSTNAVVGGVNTTALFWFEPISPIKMGMIENGCVPEDRSCPRLPESYSTITLPPPLISPEEQGLVVGDRVDVLTNTDDQFTVVVQDVLVTNIEDGMVTFGAPYWKHSILLWVYRTERAYTLRLSASDIPAQEDDSMVEYSFVSQDPLPEDYQFDLILEVPDSDGYRLANAPYSLDNVQYTQSGEIMNFWFTNIEMVSITDEINVVIRVPQSDADSIDFLIAQGANMTFNPDAG